MKILIAGASGAIGTPFIKSAVNRYEIFGITQTNEGAAAIKALGAQPIVLDILNRRLVSEAVEKIKPDVIINMLTRLPKEYTPEAMRKAAEMDTRVRLEGGGNLHAAAEIAGVKKYIVQSAAFFYGPGSGLADESCSFAINASPGVAASCQVNLAIENQVLHSKNVAGTALRFGFFYGPKTWFNPDGNMAEQVRQQQVPLIGSGKGIWNFVHVEDAAQAILSAIEAQPGIYNIVNDSPVEQRIWLPAFAHFIGAQPPPHITEEEALAKRGADAVYYALYLRGASNAKAKYEFKFRPRAFEWLTK